LATVPLLREPIPAGEPVWLAVAVCERAAAVLLLLVLSPLVALSALAVTILSRRSPFIAHRRVGWQGASLWMLKLRTMWGGDTGKKRGRWIEYIDDCEGPMQKHPGDPRVAGRFAQFCRRHSIDELPQLWHVLTGEMSLVGPRPLTSAEIRRHYGPAAEELLRVKPGIAGLWQVSGRNRLTFDQRRDLDLCFVRHRSLGMYLRILCRTLPEVCAGRNSW
jgi:lipopolysaccharide/colanic/teichoic acid biosynthesis glycosyltransferase